jgi:hypothetical protein
VVLGWEWPSIAPIVGRLMIVVTNYSYFHGNCDRTATIPAPVHPLGGRTCWSPACSRRSLRANNVRTSIIACSRSDKTPQFQAVSELSSESSGGHGRHSEPQKRQLQPQNNLTKR